MVSEDDDTIASGTVSDAAIAVVILGVVVAFVALFAFKYLSERQSHESFRACLQTGQSAEACNKAVQ